MLAARRLSMLTLTVRHAEGFTLRKMRVGMAKAWRSLWQGRKGVARKKRWGVAHTVRALEVTHGKNGWHPHYHIALFQDAEHQESDVLELCEAWASAVVRMLGAQYEPDYRHGVNVKPLNVADYLTKLGLEVASISSKEGREGSLTPWQIAHLAAAGDARCLKLWREYTKAMMGARQLFWSHKARKSLRLGAELSDRELAPDGWGGVIVQWPGYEWDRQCKADPFWVSRVQEAGAEGIEAMKKLPGVSVEPLPLAVFHEPYRRVSRETVEEDHHRLRVVLAQCLPPRRSRPLSPRRVAR